MTTGQFLDTVGMEFEGAGISLRSLGRFSEENRNLHSTRDASVESNVSALGNGMLLNTNSIIAQTLRVDRNNTYGYELVTVPLLREEVPAILADIVFQAQGLGDYISPRASIHIHVGFAYNLNLIKKALAIGLAYDPLLFMLAGMGTEYRGNFNASIYARPLEAGVAVPIGGDIVHLLPEMGLDCKSTEDFWNRFLIFSGVNRYHPGRYFATNLYASLLHSTLEFRHFNQCFNTRYIGAVINLCQALTRLANSSSLDEILQERITTVFEMKRGDGEIYIERLLKLLSKYKIPLINSDVNSLMDILDNTKIPKFSRKVPLTHIPSSRNNLGTKHWMKFLRADDCVHSGYTDIHNISQKEISVLDEEY